MLRRNELRQIHGGAESYGDGGERRRRSGGATPCCIHAIPHSATARAPLVGLRVPRRSVVPFPGEFVTGRDIARSIARFLRCLVEVPDPGRFPSCDESTPMRTRGHLPLFIAASSIAVLLFIGYPVSRGSRSVGSEATSGVSGARLQLAVLGNSDSHSFHDSLSFPPSTGLRGGLERSRTFQWTEILARLRGAEVDQGDWGVHGWNPRVSRVAGWFGGELRTPRKQDFAFNFAISGATCAQLGGARGQVAPLVRLLRKRPASWDHGAVIIRIGINDVGVRAVLDRVATHGVDSASRALVGACAREIASALRRIREAHPTVQVLVVGIADNANWPPNFDAWRSAAAMQRLAAFHDAFDDALQRVVGAVPHAAFFDDRAWFRDRWGARGPAGELAYRDVCVGGLAVRHAQGDGLQYSILADGHAGTVLNALWARSILQAIIDATGAAVPPIDREEIDMFIARLRDGAPRAPAADDCAPVD